MNRKTAQLFTIRNASGQFLGTYRRMTAKQAIQAFLDDQISYASTFKSCGMPKFEGLTAATENRNDQA